MLEKQKKGNCHQNIYTYTRITRKEINNAISKVFSINSVQEKAWRLTSFIFQLVIVTDVCNISCFSISIKKMWLTFENIQNILTITPNFAELLDT